MPQRVMPCYHGECAPLPGPVFRLQRVHVVESELLVFVAADGSGAQSRHSKLGSSSSLPLQNELDGCPSKEDINHDTTMFYRTLTFEQQQEALRQSNIILKPPIPRKPKLPPMTAEHGGCCKSAGDTNLQMLSIAAGSAANSVGAHDDPVSSEATSTDSEVKDEATHLNDEEDDFSEPAYPCICQHLEEHGRTDTIEVDEVHSTAAVRKFWLKKSMEDADISMRYRSARDPGQSQATTSSSSSSASSGLSYCAPRPQRIERPRLPPRLPPHPCRSVKLGRPSPRPPAARGAGPMQQSCDEAVSPQSPTSSVPTNAPAVAVAAAAAATANSSAGVSAVEDPPFPANSLPARTRPLTAATRIDTLERNRIDAIEDEHKYETLDHAARPGYYSEDEGVCCTNIHSQLAKKAKELVRPYQKGDHPRDRPPIPAKPPRSTIGKVPRPPSMCLEADMSSSTDADPVEAKAVSQDQNAKQDVRQHDDDHEEEHDEEHDEETSETARVSRLDDGSSDSEEEKELTPPPADPREKALTHAANVAREIASSEAVFADALKLVAEDFKGAINCGREERGDILIPDEVLESILLYLPELLKFSLDLLENLNARVERYDTDKIIADVFVKTGQFLKLYSHYIKDYQARCNYLDDARKRYPEFHQVVQQFEASPRCQKLSVMQYMLKPVQRIPQYRLLLSDYLRHLDEDHPDRQNTEAALEIVSKVADHANEAIKQGDVHAEMVRLQNSLITTRFNVFSPGRMLLKQGNLLKQNRKTTQLKRVILFTNCLVYMTRIQSNENTFKLNRELPLMGLTVKPDEIFDTEFQVLSTSKSFTLIAQNQEERQEWVEAIREAVADFERKRRTFVKSASLKGRNGNDGPDAGLEETEEAEVDRAPVWTPDSRVTMCRICKVTFTTFRRRHHCRACGGVVCGVCSKREAWFKYNGGSYERVCDDCVIRLPRERLKSTAGLPEMGPTTPAADTARNSNILFEVRGANDEDCTMSGYLKMYRKGNWKRYWYVLKERVLYVYKASADVAPMEQMVVLGYEVVDGGDSSKKVEPADACFKLRHKGLEDVVLCADDPDTAAKWKQKIRDASKI